MRSRGQPGDRAADSGPPRPEAALRAAPAATVTTRTTHILQLQRTAGNAATTSAVSAFRSRGPIPVQRHRTVQREITVETDQALPRTQIEPDAKSSNRLTVRYGAEVVAVIVVGGKGAAVDGIQVRDRTGARNRGGKIETVDLDILHPPGWTVTVEPVRAALARTKKSLGVGDVTISRTERQPPYGRDELQLWPGAATLGPMRRRRDQTPAEKSADEQRRAEKRASDLEDARQIAELRKEYRRLTGATDSADKYLSDLYGLGLIVQTMMNLPSPTQYNDIRKELFAAAGDLDNRYPGGARAHLKRADTALWAANAQVSAAVKEGIANIDTAMAVTQKVGNISTFVGETIARMIPGPWGKALTLLAELLKPAPKTMDEAADRMRGALQTGSTLAQHPPGKAGAGSRTEPEATTTVPKTAEPKTTVPKTTVPKTTEAETTTAPKTTRDDSTRTAAGGGAGGGGGSSSGSTRTQTPAPTVKTSAETEQQTAGLPVKTSATTEELTPGPSPQQPGAKASSTPSTAPKVGGKDTEFLPDRSGRIANQPSPTLEVLSGYTKVMTIGGTATKAGINLKYILADSTGKRWLFKGANEEASMGYGPALGINAGQRYRRAPAAAAIAQKLGIDTPQARIVEWNGQKGSLQEWRPGYELGSKVSKNDPAAFKKFWDSQQRKDMDALDYVIAQQDRHTENFMLKDKGGGKGFDLLAIDQDAAFPPSKKRFDPGIDPARNGYQRPLAPTISKSMADKMRSLDANWPEVELRQWLTKPEVDGARSRLREIIGRLDSGRITVVP